MSEGESLRAICRDPEMRSEGTVRGWAVRDVDGFGERYRAARQMLLEYWAGQILGIADDEESDPRSRQIRTGVRQWLMSKLAPRRYGDKVQIGGDPDTPLQILHRAVSLENLSDDQLDALQRFTQSLLIEAQPDERDVVRDGALHPSAFTFSHCASRSPKHGTASPPFRARRSRPARRPGGGPEG